MYTSTQATRKPLYSTKDLVATAMMIALTIVMMMTQLGTITLPMIRITIAHVPILITVMTLGLSQGLAVALAFGATSLFIALTSPASVLDPLFVNPLVSILPRLLIPVTAYYTHKGLSGLLKKVKGGDVVTVAVSLAVGNLTNTFGVYTMLYLVYAQEIFARTGTPALNLIITLISTTTLIKCVFIVVACTPVVCGLKKALRHM